MLRNSQIIRFRANWIAPPVPVLTLEWDDDGIIESIRRTGRIGHSCLGLEARQAPWTDPVPCYNYSPAPKIKPRWKTAKLPAIAQVQWEAEQRQKQIEREKIADQEWKLPPAAPKVLLSQTPAPRVEEAQAYFTGKFKWLNDGHFDSHAHIVEQLDRAFIHHMLPMPVHYTHVAELFGLAPTVAEEWLEIYLRAGRVKRADPGKIAA